MITRIYNPGYPTKLVTEAESTYIMPDMAAQSLPNKQMPSGHIKVTGTEANHTTLEASHVDWTRYVP